MAAVCKDIGVKTLTIKISKLKKFDLAENLDSEEKIAICLQLVLEENDPGELAHALGVVAKAREA